MNDLRDSSQPSQSRHYGLADLYSWVGFVPDVTEADTRSFAKWPGVRTYLRPVEAAELEELGPAFGEATTVLVYEHCDFTVCRRGTGTVFSCAARGLVINMTDSDVLAAVLDYHGRRYDPTPVEYRGKKPVLEGWQKRHLSEEALRGLFAQPYNIGIVLGAASGGLVDVDLDTLEAIIVARHLLPATACFGHASSPASHYLYRARGEIRTRRFKAPDGTCIAELRAEGAQTVVPPSIHESGERIAWELDCEPLAIEAADR